MAIHILHLSHPIKKSDAGKFMSIDFEEKMDEHFKELKILSYSIESMSQSSVFTGENGVIVTTTFLVKIVEEDDEPYEVM